MYERINPSSYETLESAIIKSAGEFGWTAKFEKSLNMEGDLIYLGKNGNHALTLQIRKDQKKLIDLL